MLLIYFKREIITLGIIGVMKAAHRIKGSASYLCCESLKEISLKLQDAGHEGTVNPSNEIMAHIEVLFKEFVLALEALKAEINAGNPFPRPFHLEPYPTSVSAGGSAPVTSGASVKANAADGDHASS